MNDYFSPHSIALCEYFFVSASFHENEFVLFHRTDFFFALSVVVFAAAVAAIVGCMCFGRVISVESLLRCGFLDINISARQT